MGVKFFLNGRFVHEDLEGNTVLQYATMQEAHEGPFRGIDSIASPAVPEVHMRWVRNARIFETASVVRTY